MTTTLITSSLDHAVISRIGKELLIQEETKQDIRVWKLQNNNSELVVPYYYGKMLQLDQNSRFDTIEKLDHPYDPINQHSTHRSMSFRTNIKLDERQRGIVKDVLQQVKRRGAICLRACTGVGKSILLVWCAGALKMLSLVYVTAKTFISQIAEVFYSNTDAIVWIPSNKSPKPPPGVQVIILMPKRFHYVSQEIFDQIGTVIVDEAHLICTPTYLLPLFRVQPRYLITMSATTTHKNVPLRPLQLLCGSFFLDVPLERPIRLLRIHTHIRVPFFRGTRGRDWKQHQEYLATHERRNTFIAKVMADITHLDNMDRPNRMREHIKAFTLPEGVTRTPSRIVATLINLKDHKEALGDAIAAQGLTWDYVDGDKDKYHDCDVLMGVVGKVGTGYDQKASCIDFKEKGSIRFNWAVPTISFGKPELYTQFWGRATRASVCYAIFFQDSDAACTRHWNEYALPVIESLGDIQVIEVTKY